MQPLVSIVIPTYSRPKQLQQCLHALSELDFDRTRTEVVVVDDGSEQDLRSVTEPFRKIVELSLVRQENKGPAAARNVGVDCSSGEIIAFTDDDCSPQPGWIAALVKALNNDHESIVGGRVENQLAVNRYSKASQLLVDFIYDYYALHHTEMRFFTTNNMACYADSFKETGGFSVEFPSNASEDREFCHRWQAAGKKFCYAPEALVLHAHHLSAYTFWRQHYNYGKGAHTFHTLRAKANHGSIQVEPFSFYTSLLLSPFTVKSDQPMSLASLIFLSQVANASGFFAQLINSKIASSKRSFRTLEYTQDGTPGTLVLAKMEQSREILEICPSTVTLGRQS